MADKSIAIGAFAKVWAQPIKDTLERVVCPNEHVFKHHYKGRKDWPPFCSECGSQYYLENSPCERQVEFNDLDLYVEDDGLVGYPRFQDIEYLNRQPNDPIIVMSNSTDDGTRLAFSDSFSYIAEVAISIPSDIRGTCIERFRELYLPELEEKGRVEIDFGLLRWHWY